jgi:hypothetical protein
MNNIQIQSSVFGVQSSWAGNPAVSVARRGFPYGPSNRAHPRLYHFRRFDVAWYSAGARDLSAEKRSAVVFKRV